MAKQCRYCGTPLEGYETFCPGCGRDLESDGGAGFRPTRTEDGAIDMPEDWFMERTPAPSESPAAREQSAPPRRAAGDVPPPHRRAASSAARGGGRSRPDARRAGGSRAHGRASTKRRPRSHREERAISGRGRIALLAGLAVAAALLICLSFAMLRGGMRGSQSYEFSPTIDAYFNAVCTANADQFIATRPPEYVEFLTDGAGSTYGNLAAYRADTEETLRKRLDEYAAQYGEVRSIRYHIDEVVSQSTRAGAIANVLSAWYGFEQPVQDAATVSGAYSVQGDGGTGEIDFSDLLLVKIDGEWYFSPDVGTRWQNQ